jgi:hypothetical protein
MSVGFEQHPQGLLLNRLHTDKPHYRPMHRVGNCYGVSRINLHSKQQGFDQLDRN